VAAAVAGGLLCAAWASPALGALAYWDTNETAVGAVTPAATPANGTWGVNSFWNPVDIGTGTPVAWNDGDTAVFSAGTGASGGLATGANAITVSGTQTAAQLTFEEGTNTLSGGTIVLQGAGAAAGVIQLGTTFTQVINSTITGANGITFTRTTLSGGVTLNAANTFAGPLTLASGRVNLNADGAAGVGPIIVNANTAISSTAIVNSVITLANPITLNAGSGADISSNPGVTLVLNGKLSGTGNWTHGANVTIPGTLVLNNTASDFTGSLTISSGSVVVTGDHVLGNPGLSSALSTASNTAISGSGQIDFLSTSSMTYSTAEQIIINSGATPGLVQINNLGGNNIFAGGVQFNQGTMNTIGVDAGTLTLAGQVIRATAGNKPFSKVGPGTLILTSEDTSGFNSTVNVNNGTLILAGATGTAGDIASAVTVNLNNGTLLRLDNSGGNNQDRIGNAATVNFSGANLLLKGNSGEATTENVALLSYGPGEDVISTLTVEPDAGQSAMFSAGNMTRTSGGLMVFRAPGLGTPLAAGQGQIKFNTAPQLTGAGGIGLDKSIIAGALGDTSITGGGSELVTYDEAAGVKALGTLDYAAVISSGSSVLNNVAIASAQAIAADTTVNSIKVVDSAGSIAILSGTLTVNSGMILASSSSTDGISGAGTLAFPSGTDGMIVGPGDLTVSASINAPAAFVKAGSGRLTLSGTNTLGTVYVSGGTLLPTITEALGSNSSIHVGGGGTLELSDGMNLTTVDLYLHNGGRLLGRGTSSYGRNPRISDGATVILESPDVGGVLKINQPFLNLGTGANRPTLSLRGPGTVDFVPPSATFFGNFELRNNVTVPLRAQPDVLGNSGNSLIFGPGGGTVLMHSVVGGTNWGNPVVINGDANFKDESANGTNTFGPLTVNTPSTISHILDFGFNFLDPGLTFGNTALNASPTFHVTRPPIAGDYGRLTISNVREFGGPRSINKTGEGILTIAGSAGFTGDLNASEGIVIIPSSVPTISGMSGEGIIIGSAIVKAGGHIDPGFNGVGSLLIDGVTINGAPGNKTQFNMQGDATGFDKLFVFGDEKFHINGEAVINLTNLGGVTNGDYTLIDYRTTPISDTDFQKLSLASPIFGGFNASLVHDTGGSQILLHLEGEPPPQWNIDADGNWNGAANWDPSVVPDGTTASANFFGKITAPRTVTLDGSRTVAQLNFGNSNSYTIASDGAGSRLTLGSASNNAVINVSMGSHTISAPVSMDGNVRMNITGGTSLALTGGLSIAADKTATMLSAGTLEIGGPQTHGPGAILEISSGRVTLNSNAGSPASAGAAASAPLSINLNGEGASVVLNSDQDLASIRVDFDVVGNQSFDLASPSGVGQFRSVRVYAADLASAKTSLYGAVRTANAAGAPSATDGIYDSGLSAHFGTGLGIAEVTDAHGESYILMRPTRKGDLNLDGVVSISDFIDLATNFGSTNATWQEGDLNYDGSVTISDFIDLASFFGSTYSGEVLPINPADERALSAFAAAHGAAAPEPATMGLVASAAMLLGMRRRRR
jgi:autotransporter-associated beta strand protein